MLAALLLVAACAACEADGRKPGDRRLHLEPCELQGVSGATLCGSYPVWEDRQAAGGRSIDLKIVVLEATGRRREPDPLFLLAGGPGQAATDFASVLGAILPPRVRRQRDIVLVDQRGTGGSNGLHCPVSGVKALLDALSFEMSPQEVKTCRDGLDADLRLYTTPIAMDDLDEVRAALGYDRINLWGGSYGTRAALVYMRRHPGRVRSAILRGVAPTGMALPLYFARDAQRGLARIADDCHDSEVCRGLTPDLEADLARLVEQLDREPVRTRLKDPRTGESEKVTIDGDIFAGGIRMAQYGTMLSSHVPAMVQEGFGGRFGRFEQVILPLAATILDQIHVGMFLSIVCAEDIPLIDPAEAARESKGTYLGTAAVDYVTAACDGWPRGDLPEGYRKPVTSDVPVLLISGDEDPVTPPSWAEQALETLPNGVHLVLTRTGHLPSSPGCAAGLVVEFLESGSGEGLDLGCGEGIERPGFVP